MEFNAFIKKLSTRLHAVLPGEEAQFLMAPPSRKKYAEAMQDTNITPRLSAVLILIYPEQDSFKTILIQRPEYDGVHSGQIAFPGGKFEQEDISLLTTALRETEEEIGVKVAAQNIIGSLSELYIYPSNFLVTPFIGFLPNKPEFIIDKREVKQCIETNIWLFNDHSIKKETVIKYSNGLKIKTPYYDVNGFTVWGATAMIISELNAVLNSLDITAQ